MGCTIGWIKTKSGFVMFKNRDRDPEENVLSNFILKDNGLTTFEDKKFRGCWFGINKYFGITNTLGPYGGVPVGYTCENENLELNKIVLQRAKSVEEATKLYQQLFFEQKIGQSYNVFICDSKQANIIELVLNKSNVKTFENSVFRTNTFFSMTEYNINPKIVEGSVQRLEKLLELVRNVESAEDVIPILRFHSKNGLENICRHDYGVTVGSTVLESRGDKAIIYYLLNKSPCKGEYEKEILKF
ncbi:MAG: C45 family peptidase [Nanoarchaeota archaeon]|nr:C45 family peptidase [Nanoarchaeota archaeon]